MANSNKTVGNWARKNRPARPFGPPASRESAQFQTRLTVAAEKWAAGEWTDVQAKQFVETGSVA